MSKIKGITLIELIVVMMIIGILAGIAMPQYARTREKTIDKEAQTILSLIRAAERNYKLSTGKYYPNTGSVAPPVLDNINSNLSLEISSGNWGYGLSSSGSAPNYGFNATLTRNDWGYDRTWWINSTNINASCTGDCP